MVVVVVGGEGLRQQPYYCDILPFFFWAGRELKSLLWILIFFVLFPQKYVMIKTKRNPLSAVFCLKRPGKKKRVKKVLISKKQIKKILLLVVGAFRFPGKSLLEKEGVCKGKKRRMFFHHILSLIIIMFI